ncbi:hypothetical protein BN946_scf184970.g5 [Trametes cinnabarina]|uniref:Uncharacterized protein n=1 Tax=Pycnoporus cinnabarinus TaxID=5643 RepID=A0A060SI91_PYCCI|nr:hypothetical protein BN946_scf184970.g5 [Trametes cinnabarina]
MSTPQSTPAVSPNRVRFHGPRECVLILVYPPRELQLATAAQRLSASCKLADIPPLGEDDDDESGHSTILSTPPSSVGVITPPATPRSQRQHHLIKDSSDSPTRGYSRKIGAGTFMMFIDTGSNTTWVKNASYLRLLDDQNHTCDAWSDDHLPRQVYSGKPPKPVSGREMIQQSWVKKYDDKSAARIFQYPLTDDTALPYKTILGHQVINLDTKQRQHKDLPFHYQYALAVAVNDLLEEDPTDGIIALGLSNYQATSRNNPVRVPSFLDTFGYTIVKPDPSFGQAIVMYIGLRFMPFHTPQHEKPLYQSHWDVPLVGMQIRTDDWAEEGKKRTTVRITEIPLFDPEPGQPTPRTEEQKGKSSKGGLLRRFGERKKIGKPSESESGSQLAPPQPLRVCLDTGE